MPKQMKEDKLDDLELEVSIYVLRILDRIACYFIQAKW